MNSNNDFWLIDSNFVGVIRFYKDKDYSEESILTAITKQIKSKGVIKSDHLYGSGNSAEKVAKVLAKTTIGNTQKLNSY